MYNYKNSILNRLPSKKIGLDYPIKSDSLCFNQTLTYEDEKKNEIYHMLNTKLNEIPFLDGFGCRFDEILFSDKSEDEIKTFVKKDVNLQLKKWHNDTTLKSINVSRDNYTITIALIFVITNITPFEISYDLVFNF